MECGEGGGVAGSAHLEFAGSLAVLGIIRTEQAWLAVQGLLGEVALAPSLREGLCRVQPDVRSS